MMEAAALGDPGGVERSVSARRLRECTLLEPLEDGSEELLRRFHKRKMAALGKDLERRVDDPLVERVRLRDREGRIVLAGQQQRRRRYRRQPVSNGPAVEDAPPLQRRRGRPENA